MDQETTMTRGQAIDEMIMILHKSTKELSSISSKTLEDHEQIRKNCETVVSFMNANWI